MKYVLMLFMALPLCAFANDPTPLTPQKGLGHFRTDAEDRAYFDSLYYAGKRIEKERYEAAHPKKEDNTWYYIGIGGIVITAGFFAAGGRIGKAK